MLGREDCIAVFPGEHLARIERHSQIGGMCNGCNGWHHHVIGDFFTGIFVGANITAAIPWMPEMLTGGGLVIDFTGWNIITHSVDLIIRPP